MERLARYRPGGIVGLVRLIHTHGDSVEAALAQVGEDLRDLWRPGLSMTMRRCGVLIRSLPADAALWRELAAEQTAAAESEFMTRLRARQAHYNRQALGK